MELIGKVRGHELRTFTEKGTDGPSIEYDVMAVKMEFESQEGERPSRALFLMAVETAKHRLPDRRRRPPHHRGPTAEAAARARCRRRPHEALTIMNRAPDAAKKAQRKAAYLRRQAAGLCTQCGAPRVSGWSCAACLVKQRLGRRARYGHQPWTPGSRGRVPLVPEPEVT